MDIRQSFLNDIILWKGEFKMIIYNNNYIGAFEKTEEKLIGYYTKVNKHNKSYSNAQGHIVDKYINPYSSYYRSDMTQTQREIAMKNESDMLRYGKLTAIYYDDYILKDEQPVDSTVERAREKQFNIDAVNKQITELFKENGIDIADGQEITFSINPYGYQVTANGIIEDSLKQEIEKVLNIEKNPENLFYHVFTRYTEKEDINHEAYDKFQAYREVKNHTGYDLSKLTNKDGKFLTEEGINIIDIYTSSIRKAPYMSERQKSDVSLYYSKIISDIAKKGWSNIDDLIVDIKFKNGSLHSI